MRLWWFPFLFLSLFPFSANACTIFKMQSNDQVLIGHSFDWMQETAHLLINKRGVKKSAIAGLIEDQPPVEWISRYGSMTITWISQEVPTVGLNEQGFLVAGLLLSETRYPMKNDLPIVSPSQWKQYLLDNCDSVTAALKLMEKVRISTPTRFGQHYFLADATGDVAVVEFVQGRARIHHRGTLPVPALSNTVYSQVVGQVRSSRLSNKSPVMMDLASDSDSRFFKAAVHSKAFSEEKPGNGAKWAFEALEQVKRANTQWQVVYDLPKRQIQWRTYSSPSVQTVRLVDHPLDCGPVEYRRLDQSEVQTFQPISFDDHRLLLKKANRITRLKPYIFHALVSYPETLTCNK